MQSANYGNANSTIPLGEGRDCGRQRSFPQRIFLLGALLFFGTGKHAQQGGTATTGKNVFFSSTLQTSPATYIFVQGAAFLESNIVARWKGREGGGMEPVPHAFCSAPFVLFRLVCILQKKREECHEGEIPPLFPRVAAELRKCTSSYFILFPCML